MNAACEMAGVSSVVYRGYGAQASGDVGIRAAPIRSSTKGDNSPTVRIPVSPPVTPLATEKGDPALWLKHKLSPLRPNSPQKPQDQVKKPRELGLAWRASCLLWEALPKGLLPISTNRNQRGLQGSQADGEGFGLPKVQPRLQGRKQEWGP